MKYYLEGASFGWIVSAIAALATNNFGPGSTVIGIGIVGTYLVRELKR